MFKFLAILSIVLYLAWARPNSPLVKLPVNRADPREYGRYFQGDIKLPKGQNGLVDESMRWPNNVIPYVFHFTLSAANRKVVEAAMRQYEADSDNCIRFVPRRNQAGYISYQSIGGGCYSYVGYLGYKQEVNLPQWCVDQYASVQHEILHALGFYHEQSRTDRDDWVIINTTNIVAGSEHNFDKYPASMITGFGEEYDYTSVMHYGPYGFAKDYNYPTIITRDPNYQDVIGQRDGLSPTDWKKLLIMYNCPM